jgi:hypothetical protein
MSTPTDAEIHEFWQWLIDNQDDFLEDLDLDFTISVINEFSAKVDALGEHLQWEVGPSTSKGHQWFFALSPGGKRSNLDITRHAVNLAKEYDFKFEILPAKPRRPLDRLNVIYDGVRIECKNWEYGLIGYNNQEFFDVFFVPDILLEGVSTETYRGVAWVLIDGLLGEEMVIEKIGAVSIAPREELKNINKVTELRAHLRSILDGK